MFYLLSKTLDVFLSPLTWAIALACAGSVRRPVWLRWCGPVAGVLLCVFGSSRVSNALLGRLEAEAHNTLKSDVTYDAVILLGGVLQHRESASWRTTEYNDNVERLLATFDLLRTNRCRNAILSGGAEPGDTVNEAHTLGKQLEAWGIDPSRIVLEDHALNTRENAVESARIARERGYRTLLVVTSAFHMPRALDCFRAVGLGVDSMAVDHKSFDGHRGLEGLFPRSGALRDSSVALREIMGRWVYRFTGRGG